MSSHVATFRCSKCGYSWFVPRYKSGREGKCFKCEQWETPLSFIFEEHYKLLNDKRKLEKKRRIEAVKSKSIYESNTVALDCDPFSFYETKREIKKNDPTHTQTEDIIRELPNQNIQKKEFNEKTFEEVEEFVQEQKMQKHLYTRNQRMKHRKREIIHQRKFLVQELSHLKYKLSLLSQNISYLARNEVTIQHRKDLERKKKERNSLIRRIEHATERMKKLTDELNSLNSHKRFRYECPQKFCGKTWESDKKIFTCKYCHGFISPKTNRDFGVKGFTNDSVDQTFSAPTYEKPKPKPKKKDVFSNDNRKNVIGETPIKGFSNVILKEEELLKIEEKKIKERVKNNEIRRDNEFRGNPRNRGGYDNDREVYNNDYNNRSQYENNYHHHQRGRNQFHFHHQRGRGRGFERTFVRGGRGRGFSRGEDFQRGGRPRNFGNNQNPQNWRRNDQFFHEREREREREIFQKKKFEEEKRKKKKENEERLFREKEEAKKKKEEKRKMKKKIKEYYGDLVSPLTPSDDSEEEIESPKKIPKKIEKIEIKGVVDEKKEVFEEKRRGERFIGEKILPPEGFNTFAKKEESLENVIADYLDNLIFIEKMKDMEARKLILKDIALARKNLAKLRQQWRDERKGFLNHRRNKKVNLNDGKERKVESEKEKRENFRLEITKREKKNEKESENLKEEKKKVEKVEEKEDPFLCKICFERRVGCTLGCGHLMCSDCSLRVNNCPFCNRTITSRVKHFLI